jgi:hypothetical protein
MGQGTEERMTNDIDRTRQELSRDVDALYDKVSPARVVERRKAAVRGRLSSMKDSVMGSAHGASGSASGAAHGVQDAAGAAVHAVERRTEGSPIGAGLVAFGAGMVIAALIPASQKEAQVAGQLVDAAKQSPLLDEAKAAGQEMGEHLKDSAAWAVQEVKATAQDAASQVKQEGQSAAGTGRDDPTRT